jgi:hypothetical protein
MEKSLDLKRIRINADNYRSESPTISRTYNTVNTLFNKAKEYIS